MQKVAVIIVAGGRGSRAGEGLPKQYRNLCGQPLIRRTVTAIRNALPTTCVQTVIHPDDVALFKAACGDLEILSPVMGGSTRQASVLNGLKALEDHAPDYVLVHDAARPFVSPKLVNFVLEPLRQGDTDAVIPALPIVDTLNRASEDGVVTERVDRSGMVSVQTPQGFPFKALLEAHKACAGQDLTDDGAVMEVQGHAIHTCDGDAGNFKVTLQTDFQKAEQQLMMELADIRVGSGYDVHRFEPADEITLCGVTFSCDRGLKGHSDADVGLHALTDALLSSIAAGDIGTHFPPSDSKWRGAPSDLFLKHAADLIAAKGGVIAHLNVCLICEKPKIGPHKDAMRSAIAAILGINMDRVSVQATTTEKLGFTGREEGIAAQATATVRLPL